MSRVEWCQALFACIDAKDTRGFLGYLAPDARFRYGSAPAVSGHAAIGAAVDAFFASIRTLAHRVLDAWDAEDCVICRGEVTYQRHDERKMVLPFCVVLRMRGEKVARYEIYLDPTPLAAA